MLVFGLHSISADQPSNLSNKNHLKCEKMATKLSKNEMLIFGLCLISDDRLTNLNNKVAQNAKNGCQIMKK